MLYNQLPLEANANQPLQHVSTCLISSLGEVLLRLAGQHAYFSADLNTQIHKISKLFLLHILQIILVIFDCLKLRLTYSFFNYTETKNKQCGKIPNCIFSHIYMYSSFRFNYHHIVFLFTHSSKKVGCKFTASSPQDAPTKTKDSRVAIS